MTTLCLVGDFNSRTAEISDIPDIQYDALLNLIYNVISLLQELNIDIERSSKDCIRNMSSVEIII